MRESVGSVRKGLWACALAGVLLAVFVGSLAQPAGAAFPGKNGKIAYNRAFDFWAKAASFASPETKLLANAANLTYSPDGSRVAFMRSNEIYVANADGSGTPQNITNSTLLENTPVWSHDGTRIAFQRRGTDNVFNIWKMNADGTDPKQLTTQASVSPSWSVPIAGAPDGKIAFVRGGAIWTMLADGTGQAELVYTCPTVNGGICDNAVGNPTFSPSGLEIAAEYFGDIFVVPSGGGTSRVLLPGPNNKYPGQELDPAWSPDGTKVAFEHNGNVPGSAYGIYVANADGSSTQAIRLTSKTGEVDPDWQQDSIPPQTTVTAGPASITNATSASLSFVSSETGSTFECSLDGGTFATCASPKSFSALAAGSHTFRVRATDAAGNVDATPASRSWTVDTAAPSGRVIVNGGAAYTRSASVTLSLSASDAFGISSMRFSNDGVNWSAWGPYATTKAWTLAGANGTKTVHAQYRDRAGNVSATARDTIVFDSTPPTVSGMSPTNGAAITDTSPTIRAIVRDNLTNLQKANVKLYVNGAQISPTRWSYNASTDALLYNSPKIAKGKKTVRVVATDAAGNVRTTSWSFTIR